MTEASVTFAVGTEQATVVLPVDLTGETIITGDFGGVVPAGTTARLRGNVRLTENLHVRGTLLCDPTGVDLDGQNLYDIHTHDGTLNLVGQEKTAWCRWGEPVVGWEIGDALRVAPTATGAFLPLTTTWQGSWAATTRPANTADVTLPDGSVATPEVVNLSQTVTLRNLKRIMIHEASAPNPQTLKWIRVLDSGEVGALGMYPIHFHMIGEHARGSLIEGVVVEGGKNHAIVPHASHGITLRDTVAYNTLGPAYWYDPPIVIPPDPIKNHTANNTNDLICEHVLGMWSPGGTSDFQLAAFVLGAGHGNSVVDSAMCCVQGGLSSSGWNWPEAANQNIGGTVWNFQRNVAHNNKHSGIFVWQNDSSNHRVEDFVGYNNGTIQIDHGAYQNDYDYLGGVLAGGTEAGFKLHATGNVLIEDYKVGGTLHLAKHNADSTEFVIVRRCQFSLVSYRETANSGTKKSWVRYEDCGLTPANFSLTGIIPTSIIEVYEAGVLTHRWVAGVWT